MSQEHGGIMELKTVRGFGGRMKRTELDKEILKLLNMLVVEDKMEFSKEARGLITDIAKECRKLELYKNSPIEKKDGYLTSAYAPTADDVAWDMFKKIIEAPTAVHMAAVPRLLIPILDDKLKEEYGEDD